MAVEPKRGCGWRKIGGLYLIGGKLGAPCCKLPIPLNVCPCCGAGVKQKRGWTWVDPRPWLAGPCSTGSWSCPAGDPARMGERVGLLWIGTQFYRTPEHFIAEANQLGISRRIHALPRGFKVGESWVFLAHPRVIKIQDSSTEWAPGVFRLFKPTAIEKIVTQSQSEDAEEMEKLRKSGITPVIVPDGDPDHQGSVYDDEEPAVAGELSL